MGQTNAEQVPSTPDCNSESKKSKTVFKDSTGSFFLVDRDKFGAFEAQDINTGKKKLVSALDLEPYSIVTQQEIEKLGIKID